MKIPTAFAAAVWVAATTVAPLAQDVRPASPSSPTPERTPPYRDQAAARGPILLLAVVDVVQRAMDNNLDIAVERLNRQVVEQRVASALGFYDPTVSLASTLNAATNPLTAASGAAAIPTERVDTTSGAVSLRQNVPGGASVSLALSGNKTLSTNSLATMSPSFSSLLNASVTQPLLRGFLHTATDRQVALSGLDSDIARSQFRQKVTGVIQSVLNQYWELVFAIESYEARRQSKDLAVLQYEGTQVRMQNGLLAPVAVTAARAEIASRERDLLQAEVQIINAENSLRQLLAEDPSSPLWTSSLLPTDKPGGVEPPVSVTAAQDLARRQRPEILQLRLQLSQNRVDDTFFRWERKPTVSLTANLSLVGRAGTVLLRTGGRAVPDSANPAFGGFQTAWQQAFDRAFPTWSVNLNVQTPLRNRTAEAQLAQALIVGQRLSTQMTKTTQSVGVEVKTAFQVIATQRKSLEAAQLTTQLFEEQLEAQTARYQAGFSTDFELMRYQRDLVDAKVRELRARVDLQQALITLQKATDTLLDAVGVTVPR